MPPGGDREFFRTVAGKIPARGAKPLWKYSRREYLVEGVNVSIEIVKERVIRLSSERLKKTKRGQIALTERQMQIVEHINLNGKITNRNVREMFKISDEGALKEIKKLLKLGVVKSRGKGRALHYVLQ